LLEHNNPIYDTIEEVLKFAAINLIASVETDEIISKCNNCAKLEFIKFIMRHFGIEYKVNSLKTTKTIDPTLQIKLGLEQENTNTQTNKIIKQKYKELNICDTEMKDKTKRDVENLLQSAYINGLIQPSWINVIAISDIENELIEIKSKLKNKDSMLIIKTGECTFYSPIEKSVNSFKEALSNPKYKSSLIKLFTDKVHKCIPAFLSTISSKIKQLITEKMIVMKSATIQLSINTIFLLLIDLSEQIQATVSTIRLVTNPLNEQLYLQILPLLDGLPQSIRLLTKTMCENIFIHLASDHHKFNEIVFIYQLMTELTFNEVEQYHKSVFKFSKNAFITDEFIIEKMKTLLSLSFAIDSHTNSMIINNSISDVFNNSNETPLKMDSLVELSIFGVEGYKKLLNAIQHFNKNAILLNSTPKLLENIHLFNPEFLLSSTESIELLEKNNLITTANAKKLNKTYNKFSFNIV